jgi:hypothetical protein
MWNKSAYKTDPYLLVFYKYKPLRLGFSPTSSVMILDIKNEFNSYPHESIINGLLDLGFLKQKLNT